MNRLLAPINRELQVQVLPPEEISCRRQSDVLGYGGRARWLDAVSLHPLIALLAIAGGFESWFVGRGIVWAAAGLIAVAVWFGQRRFDGDSKELSALKAALVVAVIQAPLIPIAAVGPEWVQAAYMLSWLVVFTGAGSVGLRSRLAARGYERCQGPRFIGSQVAILAALMLLIAYPVVGNIIRGRQESERTRSWTRLLESERLDTAQKNKNDESNAAEAAALENEVLKEALIWKDSTGLEWPRANDNGANVDYQTAVSYCEKLDLDGGGWQLPTAHELEGISANNGGTNDYWTRLTGESDGVATAEVYVASRNATDDWPQELNQAHALCVREGRF